MRFQKERFSMKRMFLTLAAAVALLVTGFAPVARAQVSVTILQGAIPSTTLSAAIAGSTNAPFASNATTMTVAAVSAGSPNQFVAGNYALIDQEVVRILSVPSSASLPVAIARGQFGTTAVAHPTSSTVYVAPGYAFQSYDPPIGACTQPAQTPWINAKTGTVWQCSASVWQNVVDAYLTFPPTACNSSVSGNSTGTNGFTVLGTAPSIPVVQAQTSNSSTNTHYYTCPIPVPSRTNATRGVYVVDAVFYMGTQTTALAASTSQLFVGASGTMNGKLVFNKNTYPTPAAVASQTPTGLAEFARADAGTLVMTPCTESSGACSASQFPVSTTTAGEFYSLKFTPATPFSITTDLTQYFLNVSLLNTATSATVTNSPGYTIHYRYLSEGRTTR